NWNGNGGDDRCVSEAVPGTMIVNGGAGASRYYIASNAARSLFVNNGVFNDNAPNGASNGLEYPFTNSGLSSGNLTTITGSLKINTGAGNNGTKDAIYLSAAGSTTALTGVVTDATATGPGAVTGSGSVTGSGMTGRINYPTAGMGGTSLFLKMGSAGDQVRVKGAVANTGVFVFGGAGNDTLNVGNDSNLLTDISGIVAFFGDGGTNTLNVY